MDKFTVHTGTAVPLRRSNVDTDQIIPAVYLKRVTRTGFEDGLFSAWRANEPDFVLNQPQYARRDDPRRRAGLRHRLLARARGVGAARLRLQGGDLAAVRRHLPRQLAQGRPADRRAAREDRAAAVGRHRGRPGDARSRSTSSSGRCAGAARCTTSSSTTTRRWRLLEGLDDIGLTLRHPTRSPTYERTRRLAAGRHRSRSVVTSRRSGNRVSRKSLRHKRDCVVVGPDTSYACRAKRPMAIGSRHDTRPGRTRAQQGSVRRTARRALRR